MLLAFLIMVGFIEAQVNRLPITPQFTCWFANYTQIGVTTQFERQRYLVFGYTNNGETTQIRRTDGPVSRLNNLFSIPSVPPVQVTDFYQGVHLFAFEVRVLDNQAIEWRLANSTVRVEARNRTIDTMCMVKYNRRCPDSGIHNNSSLFRGFCDTVITPFCDTRFSCVGGGCNIIAAPICPGNDICIESNLTCQATPTPPPPTISIPPTPVPTPAPTPPTLVTSSPTLAPTRQPTNAPTLAPITSAPTTKAPTTRAPTTRTPTRRPTSSPTQSPTPEPTGLATPSTLNILTRVGIIVALAVAMILVVLFAMVTRRSTTTGRR